MNELTREQVGQFCEHIITVLNEGLTWKETKGRNRDRVNQIRDLALRALDSGQREAKLVDALRKVVEAYDNYRGKGVFPAPDAYAALARTIDLTAREALREYEERPK